MRDFCAINHMTHATLAGTHIDKSHDPESIWHPGDNHALGVQRMLGDGGQRCSVPGHATVQVLQVQRRWCVVSPVDPQDTAVLCQERISHQGTDQSSQANKEMQGLRREMNTESESVFELCVV